MEKLKIKNILEAALFMSSKPLEINKLSKISGINSLSNLNELLRELQRDYAGHGIEIINNDQGWQIQVKPEFLDKVHSLTPYTDLSTGCKKTLALVIYKEPVLQSDIIKIQGNKAYAYIKILEKKGLIKVKKKGRTKILKLSSEFEYYFGEEKEKIKEQLANVEKKVKEIEKSVDAL